MILTYGFVNTIPQSHQQLLIKTVTVEFQPVDVDITCLANTVAAVLSLGIHRRIPVRVIEDDRVSASQVDSNTSGPSRQDEAENPLISVESFHQYLPLLHLNMFTKNVHLQHILGTV